MNRLTIAEKLGSEELDGAKAVATIIIFVASISTIVLPVAKQVLRQADILASTLAKARGADAPSV